MCTTLLKRAVAAGLSLFEIAALMVRGDDDSPSVLERLVATATVRGRAARWWHGGSRACGAWCHAQRLTDMMLWNVRGQGPAAPAEAVGGGSGGVDGVALPPVLSVRGCGPIQVVAFPLARCVAHRTYAYPASGAGRRAGVVLGARGPRAARGGPGAGQPRGRCLRAHERRRVRGGGARCRRDV